jgi:hypothetical protein
VEQFEGRTEKYYFLTPFLRKRENKDCSVGLDVKLCIQLMIS